GADRLDTASQRPGRDRGDRRHHQSPHRQPHGAQDPAGGDRRLDQPLPHRPLVKRLSTADPDFAPAFEALLAEARETIEQVDQAVAAIIADVRARGDTALCEYTSRFDRLPMTPDRLRITSAEIDVAVAGIPAELADPLDLAARRIEAFHKAQLPADLRITDQA